jgi:hypothetical protein
MTFKAAETLVNDHNHLIGKSLLDYTIDLLFVSSADSFFKRYYPTAQIPEDLSDVYIACFHASNNEKKLVGALIPLLRLLKYELPEVNVEMFLGITNKQSGKSYTVEFPNDSQ